MASSGDSPYVGPRPFERSAEDRGRFFGRDREVQRIVSLIVSHPLVLVYAQSGAGKTSLFNTAVWEELERLDVVLLPLARVAGGRPDVAAEEIRNLYVLSALQSIDPQAAPGELAGLTLTEYLRRTRGDDSRTRTLVFDQFEEIFTSALVYELRGDRWQEEQAGFFAEVSQALADDPALRIVFVIRKEYLAELERFTPRLPERLGTRFHLEPLDGDEALEAVEGPLRGTRRSFADGVARNLVDRLLAMRVGPGRDVRGRLVEPVQLQVVCRSLWDSLPDDATTITETDVKAFGDVDTVLGQFYDEAIRAAASAAHVRERRLRAKLEEDFITSIGTRGTVYRQDWARLSAALDELERRHLVHAEFRAGTQWYELTHDRLIDPIRESNRRLRRRRAKRFAVGAGVAAAVAALAALIAVVGSRRGGDAQSGLAAAPPPVVQANIQIASPTDTALVKVKGKVEGKFPLRITVAAVGGEIKPGGGSAVARIKDGPGGFVSRNWCHYPGSRPSASCTVSITSNEIGTTVVEATSRIPLADRGSLVRTTNGTKGNGSPAHTTWMTARVDSKPAIRIVPARQVVPTRTRPQFTIIVTNTGKTSLRVKVTDRLAPDCARPSIVLHPGPYSYRCSGPSPAVRYTNIATISSARGNMWTASALVLDVRRSIVEAALAGVRQQAKIEYSQDKRMQGVREKIGFPKVPRYEDTSSFVTWTYWQSGAPDPNGNGYDGSGNSTTLIARGKPTRSPAPGDIVFYGTASQPKAVGIYLGNGRVVIHTNEEGSPMNRPVSFSSGFPLVGYRTYDLGPRK